MNKWLIIIVICLLGCGMIFLVNFHFQPPLGQQYSYSSRIKVDDGTELFVSVMASYGKPAGFLIVICDDKQEHKPGLTTGPFGRHVKENETIWAILPKSGIDEISHVVPMNSICYVDKNYKVITLLILEDKVLIRKLTEMSVSDDKEEQKLARHLFEAMVQFAYQKEFSLDEHDHK